MDGIASLSGVGAVAGQAAISLAYQARVAGKIRDVSGDVASNALKLIQSAVVSVPAQAGGHLDVRV